jgi:hypothetical protein
MGREGKYFCDHMTICLGPLKDKTDIKKIEQLTGEKAVYENN